tara:strand:+ start:1228 stop:1428 length:201 start_codon:yes stop_codon:yes gene_type:complete
MQNIVPYVITIASLDRFAELALDYLRVAYLRNRPIISPSADTNSPIAACGSLDTTANDHFHYQGTC